MKKYISGAIFAALYLVVCPVVALFCAAVNFPYVVSKGGSVEFICKFKDKD